MRTLQILLFLMLCSFGYTVLAEDGSQESTTVSTLDSVTYSGPLGKDTRILISGTNLSECNNLQVGGKAISEISKNDSTLTYLYGDSNINEGTLSVVCHGETLLHNFYFPYIKEIVLSKDTLWVTTTIKGSGFGDEPTVTLEGGETFEIISVDTSITGKLPPVLSKTGLSVTANGLQSNLVEIPIKNPQITHLLALDGFAKNAWVKVFGTNLGGGSDLKVILGNEEYPATYQSQDQSITFQLPDIKETIELQVRSNGLLSNPLSLSPVFQIPKISKIEEVEASSESKQLNISGENFVPNRTKVYQNGKEVTVGDFVGNNSLVIKDYKILYGINVFEVENDGLRSYVYQYLPKETFPKPAVLSYSVEKVQDNQRFISLLVSNFNKDTDTVYFNQAPIVPESCAKNKCLISIPNDTLVGEFTVGRNDFINPSIIRFDNSMDYLPFIDYISFPTGFRADARVEIHGGNFLNSTIASDNFLDTTEENITITDHLIKGIVVSPVSGTSESSITITKNGKDAKVRFVGSKLGKSARVEGSPVLKGLISKGTNGVFQAGQKVVVQGEKIKNGDSLNVGGNLVPLGVNSQEISVLLPQTLSEGKVGVSVVSSSNQVSNTLEILVGNANANGKISLSSQSLPVKDLFTQDLTIIDTPLYVLNIANPIAESVIARCGFQIKNYDPKLNYGTFFLRLNETIVGLESIVTSDGKILFQDLPLPKQAGTIKLQLFKKSPFINQGEFQISFLPEVFEIVGNGLSNSSLSLESSWNTNTFKVIPEPKNVFCVDADQSKSHCDAWLLTYNQSHPTTQTDNQTPGQTNTQTPSTETKPTPATGTKIVLLPIRYQSSSLNRLATQLKAIATKLEKSPKYSQKLDQIEEALNAILIDFQNYEYVETKTQKKEVIVKLKTDIATLKKLLK